MTYLIICSVALFASGLTFFSGFGLGTLLLPVFALFFPMESAVALTAVVHFLNGLFKITLVGRRADRGIIVRFGLPAIAAAIAGAWVLVRLSQMKPLLTYSAFGRDVQVMPVKLVVALVLLFFVLVELLPRYRNLSIGPRYMSVGGVLSGFFGGLSGMQGALRSAFLARSGLSKEVFVATGVVVACLIDVTRLGMYTRTLRSEHAHIDYRLLGAAVVSAFLGAMLGNRYLKHLTMRAIQRIVGIMLFLVALGLGSGLI